MNVNGVIIIRFAILVKSLSKTAGPVDMLKLKMRACGSAQATKLSCLLTNKKLVVGDTNI